MAKAVCRATRQILKRRSSLRLFTRQDRVDVQFSDATFSFTDGLVEEVGKQVKWQATGPPADELYAKQLKEREDLGESSTPRLLQGILSAGRVHTTYFLADLKTEKSWVEVNDDALAPEEIKVGRWVDVGPIRIFDTWMSYPAGNRTADDAWKDPLAKEGFVIRGFKIDASVTSGAELHANAHLDLEPRRAGEGVLIFELDSSLRVESIKDANNNALAFYQSRETKDRYHKNRSNRGKALYSESGCDRRRKN